MSQIIPYLAPGALTNTQSDVTDLQSLSGLPDNSVNLGTFTGSTIPDNQTTKQALQALETEVEDRLPDFVQWSVGTGPGYYFDGTNDYIDGSASVNVGTTHSGVIRFRPFESANNTLIGARTTSDPGLRIEYHNNEIVIYLNDGSSTVFNSVAVAQGLTPGNDYVLAYVLKSGDNRVYINGKKTWSSTSAWNDYTSSDNLIIGAYFNGTLRPYHGMIDHYVFINRAVTDAEAALLSRGQRLGFADRGATGNSITSGTLTVGKRYRISDFQSGDDFTNVGAASNTTGVEFIATGTTPTTWTNSSSLTQIGEVLSLLPSGAAPTVWADQSGNGYNGTVTGATLINPMPLHADAFVSLTNLPTSSAGLATGRVWNDSGTLKIV